MRTPRRKISLTAMKNNLHTLKVLDVVNSPCKQIFLNLSRTKPNGPMDGSKFSVICNDVKQQEQCLHTRSEFMALELFARTFFSFFTFLLLGHEI